MGISFNSADAQIDSLIVRDGAGDPGSTGNIVSVDLKNSVGVGKMQFTLNYNTSLLTVTDVLSTGRTSSMGIFNWSESIPGQITVLIWDFEGDTIAAGTGSITNVRFTVHSGVHYTDVPLTLSGLIVYDSEGGIIPTTAVSGVFTVTEPDISIPVTHHDYGQIVVGNESIWNMTVTNIGTKNLTINYITSSSGDFVVGAVYPQSLPPDSSLSVNLTFRPASPGLKSANVYIVSDDPDENLSTITLSGSGIAPDISVSATSHDFGSVMGYDTETWVVTISNLGSSATLTIDDIASNHSDFEVLDPSFPRFVPVDGSLDVTVSFTPSQLGLISGTVTIFSNDPDEGVLPLSVTGTGYYPPATLSVVGGSGQEDSQGNIVPIALGNDMAVALVQFTLNYPASLLTITDVERTSRVSSMSYFNWSEISPGVVDVLLASTTGSIIGPGTGPVVETVFDVDPGALPGAVPLVLSDVVFMDMSTNQIPPQSLDEFFTILPGPDIDVAVDSLFFGDVLVGDSLGRALRIYNRGTLQLTLNAITVAPNQFGTQFPPFPQVIASGDSLTGILTFKPTATGLLGGTATVHCDDPNEGQKQIVLFGRGVLPDIDVSSLSVNFGEVWVADTARTLLSLFNTGTADLTIQSVFASPIQFEVATDPMPFVLHEGETLEAMLSFHPIAVGLLSGTVTIESDDPDEGTLIIDVSGVGIDPEINLSATSHGYGEVLLGEYRDWMIVIENLGLTDLVVYAVDSDHSDFSLVGSILPDTIPAGENGSVTVRFAPSGVGLRAGILSLFSNDRDESPLLVSVVGTGVVPDIHLSATTHDFGDVVVNAFAEWVFTAYNLDDGDLIVSAVTTSNSDFSIMSPLFPDTVRAGDSLSVTVRFQPSKTGPISGILKLMSNDPDESQLSVSVGGNGVVPDIAISATNHYFGLGVLCDTLTWELLLLNVGTAAMTVDTVYADTSDYVALDPLFPQVVPPGDTLTLTIGFVPSNLGSIIGTMFIRSDDPDEAILSVSLSAICVAPDILLSEDYCDFGPVVIGRSGERTVKVTNVGTWNLNVDTIYTSSSQFEFSSLAFPQTILPMENISIPLSFHPMVQGRTAASLTIVSDDCDEAVLNIMLYGTGYYVIVEFPDSSAMPGQEISIPVLVEDVTDLDVFSLEMSVSFDNTLLTALRAFSGGTIAQGWGSPTYSITSGGIDIEMSGVTPLSGHGPLVYITFAVDTTHSVGDSSVLHFEDFRFNDGAPAVDTLDGIFFINRPPKFDPVDDKTAHEGLSLVFEVTASDPDRDPLTFSAANVPAGATFDAETQTFRWTPNFGDIGIYPDITFYVSDGQFADTTTTTITVEHTIRVVVADTTRPAGVVFGLPIVLLDTVRTEDSVFSVDLTLTYDSDVLTALGVTIDETMTQPWGPLAYHITEGQIDFGIVGSLSPLRGAGTLLYINFAVSSRVVPGDSSDLVLTQFQFNDGDPAAFTIPGVLKIPLYSISGAVRYYMEHSPGLPIDSVLLSITGSAALNEFTDEGGGYHFGNLVGGLGYAVRPSKEGDRHDAVTAFDASMVTRSIVGLETLAEDQRIAADVTGNGTISALDASQILRFVVGIVFDFGIGRDWTFRPERIDFPVLDADYTDQDFKGILFGDVSGNWGELGGLKGVPQQPDRIKVSHVKGTPGEILRVPVVLVNPENVLAADFDLTYDPDFITALYAITTDLTSEFLLEFKVTEGRMRIAMAGTKPIDKGGECIEIAVQVSPRAQPGDACPFELKARLNETHLPSLTGRVTASAAPPREYALSQNYPNPFNPTTSIQYAVAGDEAKTQHVTLKIFNALGQKIRTLVDEGREAGYYTVIWDGRDVYGNEIASGLYFYRLEVGAYCATKRMILMK